jgi:glycerol-3-phosphate dehydrogenase (NAD(P)+)
MISRVAVLGDGGWGSALALVLNENKHDVTVWCPFPEQVEAIRAARENRAFLPGVPLPESIRWTADRKAAVSGADVVVLASPTKFMRPVLESFAGLISEGARLVSVAKGLDPKTHQRMTEVAESVLGRRAVAALSGPSHAEEVARRVPTAVTVACRDNAVARDLQKLFTNGFFRVYTSDDVIGAELGGMLKNVIAVAVGVSDGIGFGNNTRAALITRGLAEIMRLGCALGARRETFSGLSGMGDLIVTCTSRLSRNWSVGYRVGQGESVESVVGGSKLAIEGVWNCATAVAVARERNVEVPVSAEVYAILNEGKSPRDAVKSLMMRDLKPE